MNKQTQDLISVSPGTNRPELHPVGEARTSFVASRTTDWTTGEKVVFRFVFLYFLIQILPMDGQFFRNLVSTGNGPNAFGYTRYLFNLARYAPHFFGPVDTFANWGVVALIAGVGTVVWSLREPARSDYRVLAYWLRVILRYRLALGVLAYGFIKLFPLQAPLPSISNLNTAYGDFTAWKLFSLSLGIVPSYESFLGAVEVLGGLLLLNRRTATIGTLIILPFMGNVFVSNLAYEGGEYVYSGLLITFALALFAFDTLPLFRLVSLELPAAVTSFRPVFTGWQRTARLVLKRAFVVFAVLVYGYQTYAAYRRGPYQFPQTPGLPGVAGLYNVREFRLANKVLPYDRTSPERWQDVVFETWNTISIRSNRPVVLNRANIEQIPADDAGRTYELAGTQGRYYYGYEVDSNGHVLTLHNRNPAYPHETLRLHYERPANGQLVLSGLDQAGDSVYAVLDRINKKYLLHEAAKAGRRGTLKL